LNEADILNEGIAAVIKDPHRNFNVHPLSQEEIASVIETLMYEVSDPHVDEKLAQFYICCIEFLKTKIFLN
jgi:hypothetical protein